MPLQNTRILYIHGPWISKAFLISTKRNKIKIGFKTLEMDKKLSSDLILIIKAITLQNCLITDDESSHGAQGCLYPVRV